MNHPDSPLPAMPDEIQAAIDLLEFATMRCATIARAHVESDHDKARAALVLAIRRALAGAGQATLPKEPSEKAARTPPVDPQPGPDFAKAFESLCRIQRRDKDHVDSGDLAQVGSILDRCEFALLRAAETERMARVEALVLFNAMDHGPAEPLPEVSGIITQISNMVAGLNAALARAEQDTARLEKAILWALGEGGDFPLWHNCGDEARRPGDGKRPLIGYFWWRSELRRRAFGAHAIDAARAGASPPTTDAARLAAPQDHQEES